MASTFNYPENEIAWFIKGDYLAIVTTSGSDSSSVHSKLGDWKAVDESVTDGLLIHYYAEPDAVSAINDSIDVDNTLQPAIIDFVKQKLYLDRAGVSSDPNVSAIAMNLARRHERSWIDSIKRYGMKKRDKVGGTRTIMPYDLR